MASQNKAGNPPVVRHADLTPETIEQMVKQQMAETEVRRLELDLRMQELKHTSSHAEKILGAQERDREAERSHERKKNRYHLIFAGFCVLLLVGLIVVGMYMGKDALISDILKVMGGAIAGALGGYGFSKAEASRKDGEE